VDQQRSYDAGLEIENELLDSLVSLGLSHNKSKKLIGLSKSSHYYRSNPRGLVEDRVAHKDRLHPAALSEQERGQIVDLLRNSAVSVTQTFYDHLDSGGPYLASESTFHRIAREENIKMAFTGSRNPRGRKKKEPRQAPVLEATRPGQVLCWDISFLPGFFRNERYALYMCIDLYSRYIVGWSVQEKEDKRIGRDWMKLILDETGDKTQTVHSDNGGAMTSTLMKALLEKQGVIQSLIRPGVSNDNAQMESVFRTIKYGPTWPGVFDNIDQAEQWISKFVDAYNNQHHHTSLAGFTPAQVYNDTWEEIAHKRQDTLDKAYKNHTNRYRNPPKITPPPTTTSLNLGHKTGKTHTPPTLTELITK